MRKIVTAVNSHRRLAGQRYGSNRDRQRYLLHGAGCGRTSRLRRECAACHGPDLEGGEAGPDLAGRGFRDRWNGLPLSELIDLTTKTMPVTKPSGLRDDEYAAVVAFILNRNSYAAGPGMLPADAGVLSRIAFADPARSVPVPLQDGPVAGGLMTEWLHHRAYRRQSELFRPGSDQRRQRRRP